MKKLFFLFTLAAALVCCTEKNVPDDGGQDGTPANPTDTTGGGESAMLKIYLVDVSISATKSNHSKTVNTYFDNDNLKRTDYYQNGELNSYVEYTYSNNKRIGIRYYANGNVMSYDTIFYNSLKQEEKSSVFYPDWTTSKWQVNAWEYSGGKMINHKYFLDGVLKQNGNYTYSGNYRYGNTIGYQSAEGEFYNKSALDTMYIDALDRCVSSSRKTYSEGNGVSSVSYYTMKYKYLDDKSDRYTSWEYTSRDDWNNNGHEYYTITTGNYEYTWVNETTRYGVITSTTDNAGVFSQSVSTDTTYYHLKK